MTLLIESGVPDPTPQSNITRLSSRECSGRSRLSTLRDWLGHEVFRANIFVPDAEAPVFFEAAGSSLENMTFSDWNVSSFRVERRGNLLKDGCDDVILARCSSPLHMSSASRSFVVEPGGAVLLSAARDYISFNRVPIRYNILRFSRNSLAMLLPGLSEAPLINISGRAPGLDFIIKYARMSAVDGTLGPEQRKKCRTHLLELLAAMLTPDRERFSHTDPVALAEARYEAIRHTIREHLDYPGFSLDRVARMHGLSLRQVQRIFARHGDRLADFVRRERLTRAYDMLTNPSLAGRKILTIALDCGFQDLSTFNRAFRSMFGATPRDIRSQSSRAIS